MNRFLFLALFLLSSCNETPETPVPGSSPQTTPPPVAALEFVGVTDSLEHGFTYIRGEVKNTGSQPLHFVQVEAVLRQDETIVGIESDYVTGKTPFLLPGQSLPFEMSRFPAEPDFDRYSVRIKNAQIPR